MQRTRLLAAVATMVLAAGSMLPASAAPGKTHRVSEATDGTEANGPTPASSVPDLTSPALSLDGRWLAFSSDATNLVAGDTNGVADVFLRDMRSGRTQRISIRSDGSQTAKPAYSPALSVHGRWLAFVAEGALLPRDTNGKADIYLLDRKRDKLSLVSVSRNGGPANGASNRPFVSLFGDWITFDSEASNLSKGRDDNGASDAFIFDRRTGRTSRLGPPKIKGFDREETVAWTENASISHDGKRVAFVRKVAQREEGAGSSVAPLLASDIFIRERARGRTHGVKVPPWSGYRIQSDNPSIAADGLKLTFDGVSVADLNTALHSNSYVPAEVEAPDEPMSPNPVDFRDVYYYDIARKDLSPISKNPWGVQPDGDSYAPKMSSQGHAVTFVSEATNLVPADDNGTADVFVWDTRDRSVSRVSANHTTFEGGNGPSSAPAMSYDARHVIYATTATNLGGIDSNGVSDLYHHDRRIDTHNEAPVLAPIKEVIVLDLGDLWEYDIQALDVDGDELRYGILATVAPDGNPVANVRGGPPAGLQLDPRTGRVTWAPAPHQVGAWHIAFWAGDLRGTSNWTHARIVVRSPEDRALCEIRGSC